MSRRHVSAGPDALPGSLAPAGAFSAGAPPGDALPETPNPDSFSVEIPEIELAPPIASETPAELSEKPAASGSSRLRWVLGISLLGAALLALGAALLYWFLLALPQRTYDRYLSDGAALLDQQRYEDAAGAYTQALEAAPDGGAAARQGLLRTYAALADQSVSQGDYDSAIYAMDLCFALTDLPEAARRADQLRQEQEALSRQTP